MRPSFYRIEVLLSNGDCKNTYAFKYGDAKRYIADTGHMQEIGAASAKLYDVYKINGVNYQIVREIIHFQ